MNIGVLSCPAEFDEVVFIETHACRYSIAWLCAQDETGAESLKILLCRKSHAGSITNKSAEVKAKVPGLNLVAGACLGLKCDGMERNYQDEEASWGAPEPVQNMTKKSSRAGHSIVE